MSLYEITVPQFIKVLTSITRWLDTTATYGQKKSFDPSILLQSRLAPDQFPLVRQLQTVCDTAKNTAARLTGKEPPKNPDTEQTFDEIRQRLATTIAYLETFKAADFEGAETRVIPLAFMPGKGLTGHDYLHEFALPNFYFHTTTAYSILRHNGVDLGKRDFIGSVNLRDL
jgi:hypothetical protein